MSRKGKSWLDQKKDLKEIYDNSTYKLKDLVQKVVFSTGLIYDDITILYEDSKVNQN